MSLATAGNYCTISPPLSGASLRPAAENALSPKVLYVRVTTHVRLAVEVVAHCVLWLRIAD